MLRRILLTALIAGALAGAVIAAVQQIEIVPLILHAELYEGSQTQTGDREATAWEPAPGLERAAFTVLADLVAGVGFALLLTGTVALAEERGRVVNARRGVLWGAAGFAVFVLAPALGLPPELPGMNAAALAARQAWWLATALATAGGLGLIVFWPRLVPRLLGALLLILPHAIGAPAPPRLGGVVPPELAARFAVASLAAGALFWLLLGAVVGWLYRRLEPA